MKVFASAFLAAGAFSADANVSATTRLQAANTLIVLTFNVGNLFDSVDSPNTSDSEFTPEGSQMWTERLVKDKVANLGEIISASGADVVGLNEIENIEMARRLLTDGGLAKQGFSAVAMGGTRDPRGIQNALISRYPIVKVRSHPVVNEGSKQVADDEVIRTRDILEATIDTGTEGKARFVTFFVVHSPSRMKGESAVPKRLRAAEVLQSRVEELVAIEPERRVIVLGDFNDELDDASIQRGLRTVGTFAQLGRVAAGALFPAGYDISHLPKEKRGTYYFERENTWNEFDHIMIAGGSALNRGRVGGYQYVKNSFKIFRHRFTNSGVPFACSLKDRRRYEESTKRCLNGASDHFPTRATFRMQGVSMEERN